MVSGRNRIPPDIDKEYKTIVATIKAECLRQGIPAKVVISCQPGDTKGRGGRSTLHTLMVNWPDFFFTQYIEPGRNPHTPSEMAENVCAVYNVVKLKRAMFFER